MAFGRHNLALTFLTAPFARRGASPVAIDLAPDAVRMLQVRPDAVGRLCVVAAAKTPLPADVTSDDVAHPRIAELISGALRRTEFVGRSVVFALPRSRVTVKNVRLPAMSQAELRQAAELEAADVLPSGPTPPDVRVVAAGEVRRQTPQGPQTWQEAILLATRREETDATLEGLHRFNIVARGVDAEPLALYRVVNRFIRRASDASAVHALIDVGVDRTHVVVGKGYDVSFLRTLTTGTRVLDVAVARKLGVSVDEATALRRRHGPEAPNDPIRRAAADATRGVTEAMARDVAMCLRYHAVTFRGHRARKLVVVGSGAGDANLIATFSRVLPLPVDVGRPLANLDLGTFNPVAQADRRGSTAEWALALGLALKTLRGPFDGSGPITAAGRETDEALSPAEGIGTSPEPDGSPDPLALPSRGEGDDAQAPAREAA